MKTFKEYIKEAYIGSDIRPEIDERSIRQRLGADSGAGQTQASSTAASRSTADQQRLAAFKRGGALSLRRFITPAIAASAEYGARRGARQTSARATGGAISRLVGTSAGIGRGMAIGTRLGTSLPLPPLQRAIATGALATTGAVVGGEALTKAYDWAADKSRPIRRGISKATGYDDSARIAATRSELARRGADPLAASRLAADTNAVRRMRPELNTFGTRRGSALTGLGGPMQVNRQNGTLTTKGRTASLPSTQLVRDPVTGRQIVGDLAYRGGAPVYLARPPMASRDNSITARIGRALNLGRFSNEAREQAARNEYRTALRNTQGYTRNLGISSRAAKEQKLPGYGSRK